MVAVEAEPPVSFGHPLVGEGNPAVHLEVLHRLVAGTSPVERVVPGDAHVAVPAAPRPPTGHTGPASGLVEPLHVVRLALPRAVLRRRVAHLPVHGGPRRPRPRVLG